MAEKFTDEQVTDKVLTLVAICWRSFTDALFERFDQLHKLDIHDDQVIRALRKIGEVDLASEYIDWADAVDPDVEGGDETDVVPDPASAESYKDHPLNRYLVQPGTDITTVEQLALLTDGVVLVMAGGRAAQIIRDETRHDLLIAGSDLWENIMVLDNDDQWQVVDAGQRQGLAALLPATILGSAK